MQLQNKILKDHILTMNVTFTFNFTCQGHSILTLLYYNFSTSKIYKLPIVLFSSHYCEHRFFEQYFGITCSNKTSAIDDLLNMIGF